MQESEDVSLGSGEDKEELISKVDDSPTGEFLSESEKL